MKLVKWPKFQKLHTYSLSTPGGAKLRLFLLYRQRIPRYATIFKIAIFGHEKWKVAKVPEVATYTLFLPQVIEIELIFALRAAASEMRAHFQNCHIWA